ncbi:unnamed protein product [Rhizophagus irregularis]|nr:unnamed protein product [Rhizophagus irregularis]
MDYEPDRYSDSTETTGEFLFQTYDFGFVESIQAFIDAIDWSQPWLWMLLSFHITTLFIIIKLRNNTNSLAVVTFSSMILTGFAKPINTLAQNNWQKFSKENYFDEGGAFISILFSFPLLCNSVIGIVLILNEILHLLRKARIAQIKYQRGKTSILEEKRKERQERKDEKSF